MSATVTSLPPDLGDLSGPELNELNAALRADATRLDWSAVAVAPPAQLERLLAGLDLGDDAGALGIETVPDALADLVAATCQAPPGPRRPARAKRRSAKGGGPSVWTAPREEVAEEDAADGSTEDGDPAGSDSGGATVLKVPTPLALRDEFEDLVLADLLGPAGGPEEEVVESILDRYLVGKLAPREALIPKEAATPAAVVGSEEGDEDTLEQAILDEAARDDELTLAGDDSEEGRPDPGAGQRQAFPTTFGFTCTVTGEAETIRVGAEWGRYERVPSDALTKPDGSPRLVWKRQPMGGRPLTLPLEEGDIAPLRPNPDQPDVFVEGRIRRRDGDWAVTLFLRNGQPLPRSRRGSAWLFQAKLAVEGPDGAAVFVRRPTRPHSTRDVAAAAEASALAMLYRDRLEFAVGHGVGIRAVSPPDDPTRAVRIETATVPSYEVPQTDVPPLGEIPELEDLTLDMAVLAELHGEELGHALTPLPAAYDVWIAAQAERARTEPGLAPHREAATAALDRCRATLRRIREGIDLVRRDARAADAFRFMNRAMARQRVQTLYADARRHDEEPDLATLDVTRNRSWRPFQLAFILLNLPSLTRLDHPERAAGSDAPPAVADLLWFPTGGGKTEAYLGLAAYTMAVRRLQGTVAGRSGEAGIAVLMRYTLRLLTLQQFQRAAALICACETIRRESLASGDPRWGREPFRIGLWVGYRMTPNTTDASAEAVKQDHGQYRKGGTGGGGSPAQLTSCPWCGTAIDPGRHVKVETHGQGRGRTLIYCGDPLGRCPFSARQADGEGLPVLVVDEEIYRRLPALLIATVDKFAQMPWKGETQMLFGQVEGRCERHGFRSPEVDDVDFHQRRGNLAAARTVPAGPVRPPDLIIQDELHLISGPIGSLVGLYETAIDELATWEVGGHRIRPKVIASTATIRQADQQVHAIFGRKVEVFPPQGLDAGDNFFAKQYAPSEEHPGRKYIGVCARGERLKAVLIRVYVAHLAAAQRLFDRYGSAADPYMTLVGYFGAMRELGGMRRLVEDDVAARLRSTDQRGLARRRQPILEELTSRKSSSEIPKILDRLGVAFEPRAGRKDGKAKTNGPLDVLLATNMVSVGVDVPRLGLMVVAGQPKTTAEYIQATSRVGRRHPGLVCTVLNWARPRDLSHFERFEHYHGTFYQQVEALSVTPFAARALDRGLTALLVALVRLHGIDFNPNGRAGAVTRDHPVVQAALKTIIDRAHLVTQEKEVRDRVEAEMERRLDHWLHEAQSASGGREVGYKTARDGTTQGILQQPGLGPWDLFTCLNSLRDVEPTVSLILDDGRLDDEPSPASLVAAGGITS